MSHKIRLLKKGPIKALSFLLSTLFLSKGKVNWVKLAIICILFVIVIRSSSKLVPSYQNVELKNLPKLIILNEDTEQREGPRQKPSKTKILIPSESQACRIPQLEVNGSEVIQFYEKAEPLNCIKRAEENWAFVDKEGRFRISIKAKKSHTNIGCKISYIQRTGDETITMSEEKGINEGDFLTDDFALATCVSKSLQWEGLLWTTVPKTKRIEELIKIKQPNDWSGFDVYFIGFDSLSQMSFRRNLPKTVKFIEEKLQSVILNGYNIVGDGTPQAFIPILTGFTEEELPLTRRRFRTAHFLDTVYPFIWNNYSDAGYITAFLEDIPKYSMFNYRLKGFDKQPTDHYGRPFFLKAEELGYDSKCLGSDLMHKRWFEYIEHFLHRYSSSLPKFLLAFHGSLSHDSITLVQRADDDLVDHLDGLLQDGTFDKSVVIIMADHGNRFAKIRATHQGQLEERLPFFSIYLPQSFRDSERGKTAWANLVRNKDRLTTPFDIHATLMDLLHWPSEDVLNRPVGTDVRSISLFRPISEKRTCAQAGIEPHWCTCLQWQSATEDAEQRAISEMLASYVVKAINNFTEEHRKLCAPIELMKLESAKRLVPDKDLLRYKSAVDFDGFVPDLSGKAEATFATYQLHFWTRPGNALYEATVRYDWFASQVTVDFNGISHINKFGDISHCIFNINYYLVPYCVCYDRI